MAKFKCVNGVKFTPQFWQIVWLLMSVLAIKIKSNDCNLVVGIVWFGTHIHEEDRKILFRKMFVKLQAQTSCQFYSNNCPAAKIAIKHKYFSAEPFFQMWQQNIIRNSLILRISSVLKQFEV